MELACIPFSLQQAMYASVACQARHSPESIPDDFNQVMATMVVDHFVMQQVFMRIVAHINYSSRQRRCQ